jgi:hypothetical protein
MHAREVHVHETHAYRIHSREMHAYGMHARGVHTHDGTVGFLIFQIQKGFWESRPLPHRTLL